MAATLDAVDKLGDLRSFEHEGFMRAATRCRTPGARIPVARPMTERRSCHDGDEAAGTDLKTRDREL